MLRNAIIFIGTCISLCLLWFAFYTYREAGPIAEENLRGLALSFTSAIENLAVHDPSLAALAKFHSSDIAYFALIDRRGIYRFHFNADLIGTSFHGASRARLTKSAPSEARITAMKNYAWSGNIRELQNVMERAVILSGVPSGWLRSRMNCSAESGRKTSTVKRCSSPRRKRSS